ncbi:hypothetical protein FRC03_002894 [Tulasnella sp. 419]|nr:hypothetical protein FRC03_002894 [Tulasnella sp. 419]
MRLILPHVHQWRRFWLFTSLKTMRVICDQLRHARAPELERLALSVWKEDQSNLEANWRGWRCRAFGGGLPKIRKLKIDLISSPHARVLWFIIAIHQHCAAWHWISMT